MFLYFSEIDAELLKLLMLLARPYKIRRFLSRNFVEYLVDQYYMVTAPLSTVVHFIVNVVGTFE